MQQQTNAQLRPYVVVSVTPRIGSTLLLLEIQNTGRSPALSVHLKWDKDFYSNGEKSRENLAKLPAFTQQIDSLAPNARLQFILGVGHSIFSADVDETVCPKVFSIEASYRFAGQTYVETNIIDLRPLMNSSVIQDPVAEEVKKLRESFETLMKK